MISLSIIWFLLIGILFAVYSILDGYDFGAGMLFFRAKNENEKRLIINSIAPVWDGNEVWLVTAGGALFAAFPEAYATIFSAFYEAFVIFLFVLILRATSIEFRSKVENAKWKIIWEKSFMISSFLAPLLLGIAFGNVLWGLQLDSTHEYRGAFIGLLGPFPLMVGLTTVALFYCHGALYLSFKTSEELRDRILRCVRGSSFAFAIFFVFLSVSVFFANQRMLRNYSEYSWLYIVPVVTVSSLAALLFASFKGKYILAISASSILIIGMIALGGISLFPEIVPALPESSNSLTIFFAASSKRTLEIMLWIAGAGIPLVVIYTYYVHRIFRGVVKIDETSY